MEKPEKDAMYRRDGLYRVVVDVDDFGNVYWRRPGRCKVHTCHISTWTEWARRATRVKDDDSNQE